MRGRKTYPICACCLTFVDLDGDAYVCKTRDCPNNGYLPRMAWVSAESQEQLRYGRRMAISKSNYDHALELKQRDEAHYKELCEALGVKD